MLGTETKLLHAGKAAQNGLLAALLAGRGIDSSLRAIESPRGFAAVFAPESDLTKVNGGWGRDWELLKVAFKPYPCGIVLHPVIDACLALRTETRPEDIERIELFVSPHVLILGSSVTTHPLDARAGRIEMWHPAPRCRKRRNLSKGYEASFAAVRYRGKVR
jgi:2-methylcitrate dehydratase PrpD